MARALARAAKAKHVYRVLEIRNPLNVGGHANPMTDVIFDRNGRWCLIYRYLKPGGFEPD